MESRHAGKGPQGRHRALPLEGPFVRSATLHFASRPAGHSWVTDLRVTDSRARAGREGARVRGRGAKVHASALPRATVDGIKDDAAHH